MRHLLAALLLIATTLCCYAQTTTKPFSSLYVWGFSNESGAHIDPALTENLYKSARKAFSDVQYQAGYSLLERVDAEVLYSQAKSEQAFLQIANAGPQGKQTIQQVIEATKADAVLLGVVSLEPNGDVLLEVTLSHLKTFRLIATEELVLKPASAADRTTRNAAVAQVVTNMLTKAQMLGTGSGGGYSPTPTVTLSAGSYTESGTGAPFDMVAIPGNSPTGSPLFVAKYEVTVREYLAFCKETNSHWPEWLEAGKQYNVETGSENYYKDKGYARTGADNLPIVGVSWDDAVLYCEWASRKTGKAYRLPTEVEWEYAAKGGDDYEYAGSDNIDAVAWYDNTSSNHPHAVGGKQANGYGLYDMSGNVWEWCSNWYSTATRVLRGGSWSFFASFCRVAYRVVDAPDNRNNSSGFRVVR